MNGPARLAIAALVAAWLCAVVARSLTPPRPRLDLGRARVVVLQSDDWGLEGWFPDAAAAESLAATTRTLPARLGPYGTSSLETAADVESLRALLASRRDVDGLPIVLQANVVVAGVDLPAHGTAAAAGASSARAASWQCAEGAAPLPAVSFEGFSLHPSGESRGRYGRAGLSAAVDAAIAAGVWEPQLHGLTHFDLAAYAQARLRDDPLSVRAQASGVLAFTGWQTRTELGQSDDERTARVIRESVRLFACRFGRAPVSVIAPDYTWGAADERAWRAAGLLVVQAKREQLDPAHPPTGLLGRVRKFLERARSTKAAHFTYLDRPVRLEPYGNPDFACAQGASAALREVEAAWARGEAAVVSIHRVQLSNLRPEISEAGRRQLAHFIDHLVADEGARFLVDAEVDGLLRHGRSAVRRGVWTVTRDWSAGPRPPALTPANPR